jgi:putative ABC transport system substrate-binding protein
LKALREELQKIGYTDGQNIRLEFRSARADASLLPKAAAELVGLKVDIIVTWQTQAAQMAKQTTNIIPIVMAGAGDPIGAGLITSLARPGGNVTGTGGLGGDLGGKLVDLIREVLPSAHRVGVLANTEAPYTKPFLASLLNAQRVNIEIQATMLRPGEEFSVAFANMQKSRVDAVIIQPSLLRKGIAELALNHRLPSFSQGRQFAASGGLMSYGPSFAELLRETAVYVDKILKGSKPADLPVAQPAKFDLVINLKTAKALGLTIPPSLIARADEVIE